ncbi:MAG TPA: DUF3311 domain-containing protein [Ktedonobacteraceae bacterium]|nr:DUF3311 domain-containing protein [Ktedonobacteraceae bacterium]
MVTRSQGSPESQSSRSSSRRWLGLLLLLPFIVLLYPPFYNFKDPTFIGIPFFYWFQLLCIILTAILTAVLFWLKV